MYYRNNSLKEIFFFPYFEIFSDTEQEQKMNKQNITDLNVVPLIATLLWHYSFLEWSFDYKVSILKLYGIVYKYPNSM